MNKTQSPRRSRGRSPKRTKAAPGNVQSNGRGKGNPKQLIDKYKSLARDAMQAGDRVLAENYFQHADHYQRLLNERMGPMQDAESEPESADDEEASRPSRRRSRSQRARDSAEPDQATADPRAEAGDPRRGEDADDRQPDSVSAGAEEPSEKPRRRRAPRKPAATTAPDAPADDAKAEAMAK